MSVLHIIAGPPGIGKSTEGRFFVPESANVEILNHDAITLYYKAENEPDYENLSNIKANEFIQSKLKANESLGVEINLGYDNHYELLRYVKDKYPQYHVQVCLFFTDDVNLCLDRAFIRFKAGGHFVSSDTIYEMYNNTLTLLTKNAWLIDSLLLVNVEDSGSKLCFKLDPKANHLSLVRNLPKWIKKYLPGVQNLQKLPHKIIE